MFFSGCFCFPWGTKRPSSKGHSYGCVEGFQGLIGKGVMAQGNQEEHTHTPTPTHTSSPEGRKVSIQRRKWWAIVMIDHTARSREDAVSLSLSNSLYDRRRSPSPALMSFLFSSHVKKPFRCVQRWVGHVEVESRVKCAEHTQYFQSLDSMLIVGKCIILQQEKKQLKIQKRRKHFKWAVPQF